MPGEKRVGAGTRRESCCAQASHPLNLSDQGIFAVIQNPINRLQALLCAALSLGIFHQPATATTPPTFWSWADKPVMGWNSWDFYGTSINEERTKAQTDYLAANLLPYGWNLITVDIQWYEPNASGFNYTPNASLTMDDYGRLLPATNRFPSAMGGLGFKPLADYIHSKGLKAGIYTDAGENTCGSIWDNDKNGIGVGIYGHIEQDCNLLFKQWKYDFLKVDWCGGEKMKLDEQTEYTKIIDAVKAIDKNIVFNVCRWQFPGEWAIKKADSWRISGDIRESFSSILKIIDLNAGLYKYASPGHYNDMDMLQVGRGMSYEEDKTHFSMWCMMNSPLLAGNDLRSMSKETLEILTNKELIDIDQDIAQVQARKIWKEDNIEIWLKQLKKKGQKAIAIMNRGGKDTVFSLTPEKAGIKKSNRLRDLWLHKELGKAGTGKSITIPGHGIVVFKVY